MPKVWVRIQILLIKMRKVLIIGKIPLPIGGVTIHVSRLIYQLRKRGFENFTLCDPGRDNALTVFLKLLKYKTIHLHISNPFYQLLLALCCKLLFKRLLITYHGNWGRYNRTANWAINLSAWLSFIPIVQNKESFESAEQWNRNARLISTYIPGCRTRVLCPQTRLRISAFIKNHQTILCTNAWNLAFDKYGNETYGISDIIRNIRRTPGLALIVSDPSGNYCGYIKDLFGELPDHVYFISEPHDFRSVLELSDAFIRNTTTDGVSLSIYEALECNVPILASGAVSRPSFCQVFNDISEIDWLGELASARINLYLHAKKSALPDAVSDITAIYNECLRD